MPLLSSSRQMVLPWFPVQPVGAVRPQGIGFLDQHLRGTRGRCATTGRFSDKLSDGMVQAEITWNCGISRAGRTGCLGGPGKGSTREGTLPSLYPKILDPLSQYWDQCCLIPRAEELILG